MQELIKVSISGGGKQIVSARELYQFLGYETGQFSRWSKAKIVNNKFGVENEDWKGFDMVVEGNTVKDYALTLNFAKRIGQSAQTQKGEEVRNYFIECERIAMQSVNQPVIYSPLPTDFISALEQLLISKKSELILEEKIKELEPLAKIAIKVLGSNSDMTTTTIAKELGLSATQLNKILHDNLVQYFQDEHWVLYRRHQDQGYTRLHTFTKDKEDGTTMTKHNTKWTEKGRAFIFDIVEKHFEKLDKHTNKIYNLKTA